MSTEHSYDRGGVTDREGVTYWWSKGEGYSCKWIWKVLPQELYILTSKREILNRKT